MDTYPDPEAEVRNREAAYALAPGTTAVDDFDRFLVVRSNAHTRAATAKHVLDVVGRHVTSMDRSAIAGWSPYVVGALRDFNGASDAFMETERSIRPPKEVTG